LCGACVCRMDPEPPTDTLAVRARGHVGRDLKVSETIPHTCGVDGEYDKVIRLYIIEVRFVRYSERAAPGVNYVMGMKRDGGASGIWVIQIVGIAHVTVFARVVVVCRALVTSDLDHSLSSSAELENILLMGRVLEVVVKPPPLKRQVGETELAKCISA